MNRLTIIIAAVALVVGLAGGIFIGYASQQGPIVAAKASSAKDKADYEARLRDAAESEARRKVDLDSRESKLAAAVAEYGKLKAELDARTAALKATSFGDGIWQVGRDIQPGSYRETQPAGTCYYALLRSSNTSDIINNNNINGPATVTLTAAVAFFESHRCGTWTKID